MARLGYHDLLQICALAPFKRYRKLALVEVQVSLAEIVDSVRPWGQVAVEGVVQNSSIAGIYESLEGSYFYHRVRLVNTWWNWPTNGSRHGL